MELDKIIQIILNKIKPHIQNSKLDMTAPWGACCLLWHHVDYNVGDTLM